MPELLVVGAGVAGLTVAHRARAAGWGVQLLDKGRTPGGRLASRSFDGAEVDSGPTAFTVPDPQIGTLLAGWNASEMLRRDERPGRWVLRDGARLGRHLAHGLHVTRAVASRVTVAPDGRVTVAARTRDGRHRTYAADRAVVTFPVPQTVAFLDASAIAVPDALRAVTYAKRLVLLVRAAAPIELPTQAPPGWLLVRDEAARGRSSVPALVAHLGAEGTRARWDQDQEQAHAELREELCAALPGLVVLGSQLKRWRYATVLHPVADVTHWRAPGQALWAAGDGFCAAGTDPANGVERAVRSGCAAATEMLA